ncbi:VRR-NUC domain-containing protein [Weissella confusa]|uniref:VRR-NUC domain-containing protein n=1 Tax=Weissella confusa TaxID=1583 RepID=UPI00223C1E6B|nr:VRR-NUC domain-containing protein [Weissella confusa]MCS9991235.1 VRR-NUC domain-containing protein [Weissella confusa]
MREQDIQNNIRAAVEHDGHAIFRVNVGQVKKADGQWFTTGVPEGHPDLYGFRKQDNQVFYIEVKTPTGRPRKDQVFFHKALVNRKVIHGIARSPEDALLIINDGLVGYGFEKYEGMI